MGPAPGGRPQRARRALPGPGGPPLPRDDDRASVTNRLTASLTLRQPLRRGRGREVTTATERAAAKELEAQQFDLQHAVAIRLRATVVEYWLTTAARRALEISKESEQRSLVLLETLRRLIEAEVLPRADLVQLEADLGSRTANRIAAERTLHAAHRRLAIEIGLRFEEAERLPLPVDRFPAFETDADLLSATALARQARATRSDVRAALSRRDAAEILRRAAKDQLASRLDLVVTPSYQSVELGGAASDAFGPLSGGVDGFGGFVGFEFERPLGNRRARGDLLQAEADLRQSELEVDQIAERIGVLVLDSAQAVADRRAQLERITAAQELFATVVENEEKKLRAGTSTLIDVISQSDRLTGAQQRQVNAELALALAMLELRFQSGTLVDQVGDQIAVAADDLLTLRGIGDE
ncbi:MAG: TolC family protein [Acidobacteriota bacterium]